MESLDLENTSLGESLVDRKLITSDQLNILRVSRSNLLELCYKLIFGSASLAY